ncbi:hypothetical protein LWI29_037929 [Acer saccharum]|uniref:Uncharacterized protein n=1 Tax=Acer saccharum TaxID=4024 RepID=A0AA39W5B0_ACESA|nr:hypothetical protein LWI29_037929 [Acer saccharum]KAK1582270.1 hypothetical protein Q3G72_013411 [Acer saccharum]
MFELAAIISHSRVNKKLTCPLKLEKESYVLEEDVNKFNAMIAGFDERIRKMEELVEEKDKEMKEKLGGHKRICHENEELKKKVELQFIGEDE